MKNNKLTYKIMHKVRDLNFSQKFQLSLRMRPTKTYLGMDRNKYSAGS